VDTSLNEIGGGPVLYQIEVFAEEASGVQTWPVLRRYAEFDDLRVQIKAMWEAQHPRLLRIFSTMPFPEKTWSFTAADEVLQDRMIMMERWLNGVLAGSLASNQARESEDAVLLAMFLAPQTSKSLPSPVVRPTNRKNHHYYDLAEEEEDALERAKIAQLLQSTLERDDTQREAWNELRNAALSTPPSTPDRHERSRPTAEPPTQQPEPPQAPPVTQPVDVATQPDGSSEEEDVAALASPSRAEFEQARTNLRAQLSSHDVSYRVDGRPEPEPEPEPEAELEAAKGEEAVAEPKDEADEHVIQQVAAEAHGGGGAAAALRSW
jgi:hypothetical protein